MGAPAKFLFDDDFSVPAPVRERAINAREIAEKAAEAEARGYGAGIEAGRAEAAAENGRRLADALESIAQSVDAIARTMESAEARMETEAVDVAIAVARKLCAELVAAEPLAEMKALVSDCFRQLTSTPHLVVRINETVYEPAKQDIERLARQSGFEGRLVILAEPDIDTGDCRIEWADGGVIRDRNATEAKIGELVGRYIAVRKPAATAAMGI